MTQVKNPPANAGDMSAVPGAGRPSGKRRWQPTPVFLPGKSHEQRSLVGYSPWGCRVRHDLATEPPHSRPVFWWGAEGGGWLIKHSITWQEDLIGPHLTEHGLYNPGPFVGHQRVSVYHSLNNAECLLAQSCPTLHNCLDYSPPGPSVYRQVGTHGSI